MIIYFSRLELKDTTNLNRKRTNIAVLDTDTSTK
jgi:hypothetical protein